MIICPNCEETLDFDEIWFQVKITKKNDEVLLVIGITCGDCLKETKIIDTTVTLKDLAN